MYLSANLTFRVWNPERQIVENANRINTYNTDLLGLKEAFFYTPKLQHRRHTPAWSLGFIYGLRINRLKYDALEAARFWEDAKKMQEMFFGDNFFGKTVEQISRTVLGIIQCHYNYSNTLQMVENLNFTDSHKEEFLAGLSASSNIPL